MSFRRCRWAHEAPARARDDGIAGGSAHLLLLASFGQARLSWGTTSTLHPALPVALKTSSLHWSPSLTRTTKFPCSRCTLSIEAQAEVPVSSNLRVQYAELQQPRFARAFAISQDLDTARIMANLQDGVLKLTIPRREEARPRRIEVTGN